VRSQHGAKATRIGQQRKEASSSHLWEWPLLVVIARDCPKVQQQQQQQQEIPGRTLWLCCSHH
jgi:hypothetical protein